MIHILRNVFRVGCYSTVNTTSKGEDLMNVNITISVDVEIPDALLSMSGKSAEDYVSEAIDSADLPEWLSDAEVTITADDSESEPVRSGVSNRDAMRAVKSAQSVRVESVKGVPGAGRVTVSATAQNISQDDSEPKRAGRPPLMRDWEASDGGNVTEWGKRSVKALKDEGIACRKIGATAWPNWFVKAQNDTETEDNEPESKPVRKSVPASAGKAPAPMLRSRRK